MAQVEAGASFAWFLYDIPYIANDSSTQVPSLPLQILPYPHLKLSSFLPASLSPLPQECSGGGCGPGYIRGWVEEL